MLRTTAKELTTTQLAKRWKISRRTVESWRYRRVGPPFRKIKEGRRILVRYRLSEIKKYENFKKKTRGTNS